MNQFNIGEGDRSEKFRTTCHLRHDAKYVPDMWEHKENRQVTEVAVTPDSSDLVINQFASSLLGKIV